MDQLYVDTHPLSSHPLTWNSCKQGIGTVGFSVGVASWTGRTVSSLGGYNMLSPSHLGIMSLRVTALWRGNEFVVRLVWLIWGMAVAIMTTAALVVYVSLLCKYQSFQAEIASRTC
jgi:hypothetical protein